MFTTLINLIAAVVPGNTMKCFSTEDPDVHRAPRVYYQFEPGALKKSVCRAERR